MFSNIFEIGKYLKKEIIDSIKNRQWIKLSGILIAILSVLAAPNFGLFTSSLSAILPPNILYEQVFLILIFFIITLGILFNFVSYIFSQSTNKLRIFLLLIMLVAGFFIFVKIQQVRVKVDPLADKFSFGNVSLFIKEGSPEKIIYNNNAAIDNNGAIQRKAPLTIAVTIPISRKNGAYHSNEILTGVAIAQKDWNKENPDLQVAVELANDGYENENKNQEEEIAKSIAERLVNKKYILGVIGPFNSDAVEAVAETYKKAKLVTISPTSTAVRCTEKRKDNCLKLNKYIFRTAVDDESASIRLMRKIDNIIRENNLDTYKIAIIYENKSTYSRLFRNQFKLTIKNAVNKDNIEIIDTGTGQNDFCNFSYRDEEFDAESCLDHADDPQALLLIPSTDNASEIENILTINKERESAFQLFGADSMYQEQFLDQNKTENYPGMFVAVSWHRELTNNDSEKYSEINHCNNTNKEKIQCKAARLASDNLDSSNLKPLAINWRIASAYDAALVLLNGLKQVKNQHCSNFRSRWFNFNKCMRRNLQSIIEDGLKEEGSQNSIQGASGKNIEFNNFDREGNAILVRVENGNFVNYNP